MSNKRIIDAHMVKVCVTSAGGANVHSHAVVLMIDLGSQLSTYDAEFFYNCKFPCQCNFQMFTPFITSSAKFILKRIILKFSISIVSYPKLHSSSDKVWHVRISKQSLWLAHYIYSCAYKACLTIHIILHNYKHKYK